MKRFTILTLFILISLPVFSDSLFPQSKYEFEMGGFNIEFNENSVKTIYKFHQYENYKSEFFYQTLEGKYEIVFDDPLYYLLVTSDTGRKYKMGIHWTLDTLILTDYETKESTVGRANDYTSYQEQMLPHLLRFPRVSSSSYLTETFGGKVYHYKAENLKNRSLAVPWVEGSEGNGIGEILEFSTSVRTRSITLANGYYDPTRPDLYYANNRVKMVKIRCFEKSGGAPKYETIWNLEDDYNLQTLLLPDRWYRFELEILDVYEGTKYNDTCISGLFKHTGLGASGNQRIEEKIILPQSILLR